MIYSRSIHVVANGKTVFFFSDLVMFHCIYVPQLFIHLPTDGYLGCFYFLAIVNNVAIKIGMHIFFQISVLDFFKYIPRSEIAGS